MRRSPIQRDAEWLRRLVALVCVGALVAVAGSGVWHRHGGHRDGVEGDGHGCAVCAGAAVETGDGLGVGVEVEGPRHVQGIVEERVGGEVGRGVERGWWARGPPLG